MIEKEWYDIKELRETHITWWSNSTIYRRVQEMEAHKDFRKHIWRPTGSRTLIRLEGFMGYLKYKSDNRFRSNTHAK